MDSERWCTPPEVFLPLQIEFGFDLDAAADYETALLPNYLTDALSLTKWPGTVVWLNPPYGRKLAPFVLKAAEQAALGITIVALIPFRCRAAWWHDAVIGRAEEVRCVRKRISFIRPSGVRGDHVGSCNSCIVVWRPGAMAETKLKGWSF